MTGNAEAAQAGAPDRPTVQLLKGHSARARRGHPWVFSNEIAMDEAARALPPGTLVGLLDAGKERLGVATFNPHSLIAARVVSTNPDHAIDEAFIAARLRRARAIRDALYDAPFYRLIHSEADGLPGLIVDRYGDVAVCQINTAGMELLLPALLGALDTVLGPRGTVVRRDGRTRSLEGLTPGDAAVTGTVAQPLQLEEAGVAMLADVITGQKTGWFYDQRDNRTFIASLAAGKRVLDAYCHTGGFALRAAAAGAAETVGIDTARVPLELAREAAARAGLAERCRFQRADMFAALEHLHAAGESFDVVVADPPAFAKSRKTVNQALRAYRKLARLSARVVAPEGYLAIASCAYHVRADAFRGAIAQGLRDAGRDGRIIREAGAAPDHPVHPLLPESTYLTFLALALD